MSSVNLYVGGRRSAIEPDEVEEHIDRFKKQVEGGKKVLKFDISGRSWSRDSQQKIEQFVNSYAKDVRYLNFKDIIASKETSEGLKVMEGFSNIFKESDIIEVDLSDNAIGIRGLEKIESLFVNSNLQRLYMSNCGLSHESMELLHKYIKNEGVQNSLSELILDKNMIGEDGAVEIGRFLPVLKNMKYFSYNGCRPGPTGTKSIVDGLVEQAKAADSSLLHHLEIQDCVFSKDGTVESLCECLAKCNQLKHVDLSDADLGVDAIEKLIGSLSVSNANLTHLHLDGMDNLGYDGARILADFLETQMNSLVSFSACICEFGDAGTAVLLEPFMASRNVIEELKLDGNEIQVEGANALVSASFPKLKVLSLMENDDIPKKHVKAKYGERVTFHDEEDDDLNDDDDDDMIMDTMVAQFAASMISQ